MSTVFTKGKAFLHADELISSLKKAGCEILDNELFFLTEEETRIHYSEITEKPFFSELLGIFKEYPIFAIRVEGDLERIKNVVGEETDPRKCNRNSIRGRYGIDKTNNAAHRTATSEDEIREDENFWGKNGFVAEFRKNPLRRSKISQFLKSL